MGRSRAWMGVLLASALLAGCAGDVTNEIRVNEQVRGRVMDAFASEGRLAEGMTRRLLAEDSLRVRVVETVLHDSRSAQYILGRIGHSPDAVDLVLQSALADSTTRPHVLTLLKGLRMGLDAAR